MPTCTWSSSVTGSEVLVDLSDIRFLFTATRGLTLDRSRQRTAEVSNTNTSHNHHVPVSATNGNCCFVISECEISLEVFVSSLTPDNR